MWNRKIRDSIKSARPILKWILGKEMMITVLLVVIFALMSLQPVLAGPPSVRDKSGVKTGAGMSDAQGNHIRNLVEKLVIKRAFVGPSTPPRKIQKELIGMGRQAVPYLIEGLSHQKPDVRKYAAQTLCQMGKIARPAKEALIHALNDNVPGVRFAVIRALKEILESQDTFAAEPLIALFRREVNKNRHQLEGILQLFNVYGPRVVEVVPDIIKLMDTEKAFSLKSECGRTLGHIGPPAESAIPQLKKLLASKIVGDSSIAAAAIVRVGLEKSGLTIDNVFPHLLKAFGESKYIGSDERHDAEAALSILGRPAEERLAKQVFDSLKRKTRVGRYTYKSPGVTSFLSTRIAVKALDGMGAQAKSAISAHIAVLNRSDDVLSRAQSIHALGKITGKQDVVLSALRKKGLTDNRVIIRVLARAALQKGGFTEAVSLDDLLIGINKDQIVPGLIGGFGWKMNFVDTAASDALKEIGEDTIPQLVLALRTKPPFEIFSPPGGSRSRIAEVSQEVLASWGEVVVPHLINGIYETDSSRLFNRAIMMLQDYEFVPRTEKEKIVYHFAKESRGVVKRNHKRYKELSKVGPAAAPFLIRVSKMDGIGSYASVFAVEALGELDEAGRRELNRLVELINADSKYTNMGMLYEAVSKIGGENAFKIMVQGLQREDVDTHTKLDIIMNIGRETHVDSKIRVAAVKPMLRHDNEKIKIITFLVLSRDDLFHVEGVKQLFVDGLSEPNPLVKYNVINYLGRKGRAGTFALTKLKALSEDPQTETNYGGLNLRSAAKKACQNIQEPSSP